MRSWIVRVSLVLLAACLLVSALPNKYGDGDGVGGAVHVFVVTVAGVCRCNLVARARTRNANKRDAVRQGIRVHLSTRADATALGGILHENSWVAQELRPRQILHRYVAI